MPRVELRSAPLVGGVSTQPPTNRGREQVEAADNVTLHVSRGLEMRSGSEFIQAEGTQGQLDATGGDTSNFLVHWIDSDEQGRYVVLIDGDRSDADIIQIYDLTDGSKQTVSTTTAARAYIRSGSGEAKDKLRAVTIANTTFLLNREVATALTGTSPAYTLAAPVTELPIPPNSGSLSVGNHVTLLSASGGYPAGIYEVLDATSNFDAPWYQRKKSNYANSDINASTMPIRLDRNPSTGAFSADVATWTPRYGGSPVTNPGPSFIGSTIDEITLFQDRLWFASGDKLVSSQAGDYFNLWIDDPATVTDADPVDIFLSGDGLHKTQWLVPFNRTLLVMADGSQQYEVGSRSVISPAAVELTQTTRYRSSNKCRPVVVGNQAYYVSEHNSYSHVWEYFYNFDNDANLAVNTSEQAEGYLPKNIVNMTAAENDRVIFARSTDQPANIYCYFYLENINQKVQSAWCRWVFDAGNNILGLQAVDSDLYLLVQRDDKLWLEKVPVSIPSLDVDSSGTLEYSLRLDRKHYLTGTYSTVTGKTTFALPYKDSTINTAVLGAGFTNRDGLTIKVTNDSTGSTTNLTATGNFSAAPVWVGRSYNMAVTLSEQVVRDDTGQTVEGTLNLLRAVIRHKNTKTYQFKVTPAGRQTKIREFNANRVGTTIVGDNRLDPVGTFDAQVFADASDAVLEIAASGPTPVQITNIEFQGRFIPRRSNPAKR